jgi:hypothetical protein
MADGGHREWVYRRPFRALFSCGYTNLGLSPRLLPTYAPSGQTLRREMQSRSPMIDSTGRLDGTLQAIRESPLLALPPDACRSGTNLVFFWL